MKNTTKTKGIYLLTTLFFMLGFITCLNDILIPYLKKIFELSYFEAMLVQFTFFGAYFIGSLIYLLISIFWKDPISKIGYKNGIIIGLTLAAFGCFLFYPASLLHFYPFFLSALFILGLGFTMLQIAANPFVAIIGTPETASSRLTMVQGFNSLGTTIAPIIGGIFIFKFFNQWGEPIKNAIGENILTDNGLTITSLGVQIPYIIFGTVFVLLALIFYFSKLATAQNETADVQKEKFNVFQYPHLVLGFLGIFFYVGAEVSIGSLTISYLGETKGMAELDAKTFLAFYWGGAMIGRFVGSISLSDNYSKGKKLFIMTGLSLAFFALIFTISYFENGMTLATVLPYIGFMILNLSLFYLAKSSPNRTISYFAITAILMLIASLVFRFEWIFWSIISIGLFNSIMFPSIFTLAIKDLGKHTAQGSSILIMAILGGAILPLIQGKVADHFGIAISFVIPIISYIYIAFYGIAGYKSKVRS